ncbi:MAG: pantoate--beta-alanine ligase [Proteobacteria bacterium]|nr:pantoate--beta-alanine ligase [Pseudomonadota bacterium]
MIFLDSYQAWQRQRKDAARPRSGKAELALVPTMGNFHPGHLSLVDSALERAELVMISIYINPTQFNQREDYIRYPRTLDSDLREVEKYPNVIVFTPSDADIYPFGIAMDCSINPPRVANILEGEFRLGHFSGVTTVVAKLLNLVQPQLLVLGKKDYQQLRVLEQMALEMRYPCEIFGAETVRDKTGLACSSRNRRLKDADKSKAPLLYQQLSEICTRVAREGFACFEESAHMARERLSQQGFSIEYLQLRTQKHLHYASPQTREAVVLCAAWLGNVRLIDSVEIVLPAPKDVT